MIACGAQGCLIPCEDIAELKAESKIEKFILRINNREHISHFMTDFQGIMPGGCMDPQRHYPPGPHHDPFPERHYPHPDYFPGRHHPDHFPGPRSEPHSEPHIYYVKEPDQNIFTSM